MKKLKFFGLAQTLEEMKHSALKKKLKWVQNKAKSPGVCPSTDPKVTMEANYSDRLAKVNQSLGS